MAEQEKEGTKRKVNLEERINRIQQIVAERGEDASKVVKHWLEKDAQRKSRK